MLSPKGKMPKWIEVTRIKMPKTKLPKTVKVILKKDYSLTTHIRDAAKALVNACPEIFKKDEPYPTARLVKFGKGEVVYEIFTGSSKAKTGLT